MVEIYSILNLNYSFNPHFLNVKWFQWQSDNANINGCKKPSFKVSVELVT